MLPELEVIGREGRCVNEIQNQILSYGRNILSFEDVEMKWDQNAQRYV